LIKAENKERFQWEEKITEEVTKAGLESPTKP
jgi:hypothetical protein